MKLILPILIFLIFLPIIYAQTDLLPGLKNFIVGEGIPGGKDGGDSTFRFWVEGPSSFDVGEKIPITLYVQNLIGETTDYTIESKINSEKYHLIQVELDEPYIIEDVDKKEIRTGTASIIIFASDVEGTIRFTATSSVTGGSNWDDITIGGSEMTISLPEFNFIGILILISLSSLIYFI